MKKKLLLYLALFGLVPLLAATGGEESPVRFLYYPLLVLFIPLVRGSAHFQVALIFSILYALLPIALKEAYPAFTVATNVLSFLLTSLATGHLADYVRQERESFRKASDSYHGLTNALNLNIMNLQAKVDSATEAYEGLQRAEKNKSRFISGVSHEIRSPLSAIRSFSEILLNYEDIEPDTRREFLGIINKESERLTQLANEILDVVRMEQGKVEWRMDEVDLREVVDTAVKTMAPMARDKGLALGARLPAALPAVRGDRSRLLQVVLNLLSNAIKFTSQGGVTAGVEETPDAIKAFVSDTGEGIYPEEKEKIFDEFFRIGDELAGRPKGSGLGLSISRRIVEAHRGSIWAESELGKGSTFYFSIPREAPPRERREEAARRTEAAGGLLLVLEGCQPVRQMLRGAIEGLGYKTLGAESNRSALNIIKIRRPDAIVTGYPRADEHFDELRAYCRVQGIQAFVVSVVNDERLGPQVALNGYISKPFDAGQIASVLEEALEGRKGRLLVLSPDPEEARGFQVLVGARGYETAIVPGVDAAEQARAADAIVIGAMPPDDAFRAVDSLRKSKRHGRTPLFLALDVAIRDTVCIGLGPTQYGGGLEMLVRGISERVKGA